MDFPRLQIMFIAIALLIATLSFLDLGETITLILVTANLFCVLWQLWWILPYTPLWRKEVKSAGKYNPDRHFSILTSNVLTPNKNSDALIKLVNEHKPDILVTLESDKWWEDQLSVLESDMPYTVKCPLDNLYGMHVYSKFPLSDTEIKFLVEEKIPSIHTCIELRTGDKVRAHFVHPAPPSPTENEESTERDAELIIVARSVAKSKQPILVTGDLNDVAWSSTTRLFRKISGLLDPRIGRGMFNTFNAKNLLLRWPLDHVFHSEHFTLHTIKRLPSIDSDHFPLFTSLVYTPVRGATQEGIEADAEDHERAREVTNEKGVSEYDVPEPNE
jgi:endonuclease/exonuclease/phosphatase (EEP) superfamily protein YafD